MNILEAQQFGRNLLNQNNSLSRSSSINLDIDVFLQEILNCDRTALIFKKQTELTTEQEKLFVEYVEKRNTGLPVAYIVGHKEFFGYDFVVNPRVLIPKPDTEILVENGINALKELGMEKCSLKVCDMCSGSGCVGISIAKYIEESLKEMEFPTFTFVDISAEALKVTEENAKRLLSPQSFSNCSFVKSNLFAEVHEKFDLIVTNPPYVPQSVTRELLLDGRSEPILALDGDVDADGNQAASDDGLEIIRNLTAQCKEHLNKPGQIILEAGEYNIPETEELLKEHGFVDTTTFVDLEGQLRNVRGRNS